MCTSFVFRKNTVFVGMNFDNDGKAYKVSDAGGKGFLISVKAGNAFYPSIGINPRGIFANHQTVDPNENGGYKRQNEKRWTTSKLIDVVLKTDIGFSEIAAMLERIEIVNVPNSSAHVLIVAPSGDVCVVEPGRKNIVSPKTESDWFVLTNFPLSDCGALPPQTAAGSGSDRYMKGARLLREKERMTVEDGFSILNDLRQDGPVWVTELSLMYDAANSELYYCERPNFEEIKKIKLALKD